MRLKKSKADYLWDAWCVASVIGIWPRFIEPNLLLTTELAIHIPNLSKDLENLKILQISDLHWGDNNSPKFLSSILDTANELEPDLIVFTGDFLCYGSLEDPEPLQDFLNAFDNKYGCFAILGNHDYQEYVSVNEHGEYDIANKAVSPIKKGWGRVLSPKKLTGKITESARNVTLNQALVDCLKETQFKLLHNDHQFIQIGNSGLNIIGLGEHMLGRCEPDEAFKKYISGFPGVILLHNPDGLPSIQKQPGDIVLCGHTHGGQVNLPYINRKFLQMENTQWKRGLHDVNGKSVYVNRGMGSVMPFRWFSAPEMLLLTLTGEKQ